MFKFYLANKSGVPINAESGLDDNPALVTESLRVLECHWKSGINAAATTTTIVAANANESIMITDIIITSSKKVANSTVIVRLSDGTNTEIMMVVDRETAPVEFSHSFAGGVRGWKEADFQVVTNKAAMYVVTLVGYVHLSAGATMTYTQWDADR